MYETICMRSSSLRSDNLKSKIQNRKWAGFVALVVGLTLWGVRAEPQQPKPYPGGREPSRRTLYQVVDGLRAGLKELGLQEGKQLVLEIRDTKGDLKSVEEVARNLEGEKVNLLYTINTSVTIAARRATAKIPIVFYAGTDPVAIGLVESFAKPGGRLTGVHSPQTDTITKRLEILKEILPKLHRVLTFYNPGNPVAIEFARLGRDAT
jgi:ABC-type uncharacterized transport system substrate-binding protein